MDHPAAHRDGVPQHFIRDAELFERVNAARREREIDRAPADEISLTRISAPLVKIDFVSAPAQYAASNPPARPLPMRTNFATFRVNHERKNTASGDADG